MQITERRTQTAFRFRGDLLVRLKQEAARQNRSLNNYVESVLMGIVYGEPNKDTVAAINESRSGKYAGTVETSSLDAFKKSMGL